MHGAVAPKSPVRRSWFARIPHAILRGLWFLFRLLLVLWATLVIYYSNLPWFWGRAALALAFLVFGVWALWFARRSSAGWAFVALFFGVCGAGVLLTPLLDRGPISRGILVILAAAAVAFFIVMTAWGRFSGPDEGSLRFILGFVLVVIVLPLLVPFTKPASVRRHVVYSCFYLACLALLVASWWEFLI